MRRARGQTLLEALIAIGIILSGVIGASTLILTTITAGRVSQNRIEAANFAREGVEAVRSLRDSNWLKFQQNEKVSGVIPAWNTGLAAGQYILQLSSGISGTTWVLVACPSGTCSTTQSLMYKYTSGSRIFYTQTLAPTAAYASTKYARTIRLEASTDDAAGGIPQITVESTVTWPDRTGQKTLTATTRLYDWK